MNDEILVRVMHCGTNRLKQLETSRDIQTIRVAIGVNGDAIDVLHDYVGGSVRQGAAVQEMRDVGMIQLRKDLTLDFQTRLNSSRQRAAVNHLDGHLLFELGVGSLGKVNLPHPADTQGVQYAIVPYAISHHFGSMHPGAAGPQTLSALAAGCCLRV